MKVSAIIVTRGDVPLGPVLESLPSEWEVLVMDNANGLYWANDPVLRQRLPNERIGVPDLVVYGRYWAIEYASHPLIYVADDDVIVSDPQAIVDAWLVSAPLRTNHLVANMPPEFRHDGYTDSALVGFGACFHRDAPARAFDRVLYTLSPGPLSIGGIGTGLPTPITEAEREWFYRTCDVVFTTLTPRVLVDVPKVNREFAEDASRMYRQPGHVEERQRMLELARKVRDG